MPHKKRIQTVKQVVLGLLRWSNFNQNAFICWTKCKLGWKKCFHWLRVLWGSNCMYAVVLNNAEVSTCVKLNFCVWVKCVPLVRIWPGWTEPLKACRSSHRSEVERETPKALWEEGRAAERSWSSIRLCNRVNFRKQYSCYTTSNKHVHTEVYKELTLSNLVHLDRAYSTGYS